MTYSKGEQAEKNEPEDLYFVKPYFKTANRQKISFHLRRLLALQGNDSGRLSVNLL
jgi:hypothetical protein